METNKPLSVMRASLAGKQRTHAVKIYGSIDQITIVLSHEPVHLVSEEGLIETLHDISKMWTIYYVWALSQSMVNVG